MNRKATYVLMCLLVTVIAVVVSHYKVAITPNPQLTAQTTQTGNECDLTFNKYDGSKEDQANGLAYAYTYIPKTQFFDALRAYNVRIGATRVLYYGTITINLGTTQRPALWFFDNGAAIIYFCD